MICIEKLNTNILTHILLEHVLLLCTESIARPISGCK